MERGYLNILNLLLKLTSNADFIDSASCLNDQPGSATYSIFLFWPKKLFNPDKGLLRICKVGKIKFDFIFKLN